MTSELKEIEAFIDKTERMEKAAPEMFDMLKQAYKFLDLLYLRNGHVFRCPMQNSIKKLTNKIEGEPSMEFGTRPQHPGEKWAPPVDQLDKKDPYEHGRIRNDKGQWLSVDSNEDIDMGDDAGSCTVCGDTVHPPWDKFCSYHCERNYYGKG